MKQQDLVKYHQQSISELEQEVQKLSLLLVDTRMKVFLKQEKNLHAVKTVRQDIARLKTIIRHKQLSQNTKSQPSPTTPTPNKTTKPKTKPTPKPKKTTVKDKPVTNKQTVKKD